MLVDCGNDLDSGAEPGGTASFCGFDRRLTRIFRGGAGLLKKVRRKALAMAALGALREGVVGGEQRGRGGPSCSSQTREFGGGGGSRTRM